MKVAAEQIRKREGDYTIHDAATENVKGQQVINVG